MKINECFSMAWLQIRKNRLRAVLTILGIVIGIASMVTVVSVGESGQNRINDELLSFGINRVWLFTEDSFSGKRTLCLEDAELIENNVSSIAVVSPAAYTGAFVASGGKRATGDLAGVTPELARIENVSLAEGRFLSQGDMDYERRVIVLSHRLREELFGKGEALGESVTINGASFRVIGVLAENGGLIGAFVSPKSFMPANVFMDVMHINNIDEISISAMSLNDLQYAADATISLLTRKYGPDTVKIINLTRELENANNILDTFKLVIGAIACISLIVGGIGIMNIMLVTVRERTREIGIKKTCGARERDIFGQFLCEALIFAVIGGGAGVVVSIILTYLAQSFAGLPFHLSPSAAALAVALSGLIGVLFGVLPARKAGKLDPVVALRQES